MLRHYAQGIPIVADHARTVSADFDRLTRLLQVWIPVKPSRRGLGISGKRLVFKGFSPIFFRAGDEIRTRDVQLGKLAFYR